MNFVCLASLGVCWVYPLIQTFESIQKREFDRLWMSYWVLLGLLTYLEMSLFWWLAEFSFYTVLKTLFCLWMTHSNYKGAEFIEEKTFELIYENASQVVEKTPLKGFLEPE
mmetsp:Transcript_8969/g.13391  ORF Transcript_8969/g.13391 Transcript_8969/m.13391 type:complete len:111 (+) Transcript_8969:22-354(+)